MIIIEILYLLTALLLAVYGCHNLVMTWLFVRTQKGRNRLGSAKKAENEAARVEPELDYYPIVTVQLPIYNERHVVERLLDAAVQLDWPRDCLEIQVLDDSTDETSELVQQSIERYRHAGIGIEHVQRINRQEFKAGALEHGRAYASGEFVAIFDADFIPTPDFLKQTIPHFFEDEAIGCVQTRWGHTNPNSSWFTRAQSLGIDGHFIVEQTARSNAGAYLNFNGTAGVWRAACLDGAGGWNADTLTEDLDISYRAQLAGWRILYLPEVVVPAELPVHVNAFKSQQFRWAKGSIQTAIKVLGGVWATGEPFWRKLFASIHLTNYVVHPLLLFNLLFTLPITYSSRPFIYLAPIVFVSAIGPSVMYFVASRTQQMPFLTLLRHLAVMISVGIGLSVSNSRAVLEAILGIRSDFKRTPKFALLDRTVGSISWYSSDYVLPRDPTIWVESALGLYAFGLIFWGISQEIWWLAFWMTLYVCGYGYMVSLALIQMWQTGQLKRSVRPA